MESKKGPLMDKIIMIEDETLIRLIYYLVLNLEIKNTKKE